MNYTYQQSTGKFWCGEALLGIGYSGAPAGKNRPEMQDVKDVGPIPVGTYAFGAPVNDPKLGPLAIPLAPDSANEMFGRSGFYCHGDSLTQPGAASHGCIILDRQIRLKIITGSDKTLTVTK